MEFDFINLISNVGFPIAITIYLLWKGDKTLESNTKALQELSELIARKLK